VNRRPYFSNEDFESICEDELAGVDLLPSSPEPIRIERFIEKRFGVTPLYVSLPDQLLGVTVFGSTGVQDVLIARALDEEGSFASQRRVRTTLGHEAGHAVLHAHLYALDLQERPLFGNPADPPVLRIECKVDPTKMKTATDGYRGEWKEFQANQAMSCFLLPRRLVHQAIAPYSQPAGTLGSRRLNRDHLEDAIRTLARIFDVNPQVVRLRLDHLYPEAEGAQQLL
jgi:hypothetical protein